MSAVLLVSVDPGIRQLAERALSSVGHELVTADTVDAAIRSLFSVSASVVIVDSSVGEESVEGLTSWLRDSGQSYPLVFLAASTSRWLGGGPPLDERNEIVMKPFEARDIIAALERVLDASGGSDVLLVGEEVVLDRSSHELRGDGASVQLTPTEFRLMHYLAQRRGSIVPTEELLEQVWEFYPGTGSSELVRSHVRNLRGKLRIATGGADLVQTVPRRGYRLA